MCFVPDVRGGDGRSRDQVVAERLFTAGAPTAGAANPYIALLYDRDAAIAPSKHRLNPGRVLVDRGRKGNRPL
jgi:hypothetical protein